jgi:hypothetical protein
MEHAGAGVADAAVRGRPGYGRMEGGILEWWVGEADGSGIGA